MEIVRNEQISEEEKELLLLTLLEIAKEGLAISEWGVFNEYYGSYLL